MEAIFSSRVKVHHECIEVNNVDIQIEIDVAVTGTNNFQNQFVHVALIHVLITVQVVRGVIRSKISVGKINVLRIDVTVEIQTANSLRSQLDFQGSRDDGTRVTVGVLIYNV